MNDHPSVAVSKPIAQTRARESRALRGFAIGSVLMEFILVCPLLVLLVSMILQFSQIWVAREITAYAAYCACRSVLSAGHWEDAELGAQRAAELACAWMALAGMPEAVRASSLGSSETVDNIPKLHGVSDINTTETVYMEDGAPVKGEILIPGWGSIPGSDSVGSNDDATNMLHNRWEHGDWRVRTMIVRAPGYTPVETEWDGFIWRESNSYLAGRYGDDEVDYALVRVKFKFPLLLPLAGRMISWFVSPKASASGLGRAGEVSYGTHQLTGGNKPAWRGQETVMDENGNLVDRSSVDWATGDKFPAIELTEYCMLPMPYHLETGVKEPYIEHLPKEGYPRKGGGS